MTWDLWSGGGYYIVCGLPGKTVWGGRCWCLETHQRGSGYCSGRLNNLTNPGCEYTHNTQITSQHSLCGTASYETVSPHTQHVSTQSILQWKVHIQNSIKLRVSSILTIFKHVLFPVYVLCHDKKTLKKLGQSPKWYLILYTVALPLTRAHRTTYTAEVGSLHLSQIHLNSVSQNSWHLIQVKIPCLRSVRISTLF
jgi:hypothetical protein